MALPTSGNLSFSQILTEFGKAAGTKLSQLYRGGGIVPDIPANAGVPTSGAIAVRNFLGASNMPDVTMHDFAANSSSVGANSATAKFSADGYAYSIDLTTVQEFLWHTGGGVVGDFDIRASNLVGDTPSGNFNVWTSLATDQSWTMNSGLANVVWDCTFKVEIRKRSTGDILGSCNVHLTAERQTTG